MPSINQGSGTTQYFANDWLQNAWVKYPIKVQINEWILIKQCMVKKVSLPPDLLFFLLKILLAIGILFGFIYILRLFFYFCRKFHWDFDRNCIEFFALGSMDILTLSLLIHGYRISYPFFNSKPQWDITSCILGWPLLKKR